MSTDPIAQQITIQPQLPPAPLILCDPKFLHTLAVVERDVAQLAITDAPTAQAAATLQGRLTAAAKALEDARTKLKAPFLNAGRMIDDAAKNPGDRISAAKRNVGNKLVDWQLAERRRVEQEEADKKKAQEEAGGADFAVDFGDAPVVTAPVAAPVGVVVKVRLVIESIDVGRLPDKFVTRIANEVAIRGAFCVGWKEGDAMPVVDGCVFKVERTSVSTGRGAEQF